MSSFVKTKNLAAQLSSLSGMDPERTRRRQPEARAYGLHQLPYRRSILTSSHIRADVRDHQADWRNIPNNSFHGKPQIRAEARDINRFVPNADKVAAYFASINRSTGEPKYDLKGPAARERRRQPRSSSPNMTCPIRRFSPMT